MSRAYTENAVGLPNCIMYGGEVLHRIYYSGWTNAGLFFRVMYSKDRNTIREYFKKYNPEGYITSWKETNPEKTTYYGILQPMSSLLDKNYYRHLYISKSEIMLHAWQEEAKETDMSLHVHIHEHSHGEAVWGDREKPAWYNGKYVLMVKFNQLSPGYTTCSDKLYGYMTNNNTIRPGDFVAVMSPVTGVCAAEVVEVHERAAIAYNATKWIIGKIDLTEYNQHTERMKRLADLEKIIAQRKREIAAQMDLEMVASNSPQDEALVREFDSLRNWGS